MVYNVFLWIESSKEQHLFVINIFTVSFDLFNASLLNESISFFFSSFLNLLQTFQW